MRVNSVSRLYLPFSRSEPLSDSDSDSVTKIVIYRFWLWKLLKGSLLWYRPCRVLSSVSVCFRGKKRLWKIFGFDRARNEMRTKKWKRGEGEGKKGFLLLSSPPPPRSFACAILCAVFNSCSSYFAPKPHRNACYACYLVGSPGGRGGDVLPIMASFFFPKMAKSCTWI